jgi:probable F420-dependent oxidoreductase
MKVDGSISTDITLAAESAARVEAAGYDGAWVPETRHDPFLACALAAEHTERLEIGTSVALAFARSPMSVAQIANDLHTLARGRFILGLGSQVKAHIERRFSMPWSRPAARMREYVCALRAIWASWAEGSTLDFQGDFYTHTLMTPFFDPGPNPYGTPKIFLAGVGPMMTEVAGEVADGFICHRFSTERSLRELTLPALARGRARAGKTLEGFEIAVPAYAVSAFTQEDMTAAITQARRQLAFYGSTPAYRPVLEVHGWGDVHEKLHAMSKDGLWETMAELIDDDMLKELAIVAEPDRLGAEARRRYRGIATRISFNTLDQSDLGKLGDVRRTLQED